MEIPLQRLQGPFDAPPAGAVRLVVARHQAQHWPSDEVVENARNRARLIHRLIADNHVSVESWGDTDADYPREVVELVLQLAAVVVPSVATVLAAWIARNPGKGRESVPGFVIVRSDGSRLEMTYRDNFSKAERKELIEKFLADK